MRIAASNNYSWRWIDEPGTPELPNQHRWGTDHLTAAGHTVRLVPSPPPASRGLLQKLEWRYGHPIQQAATILARVDIAYAANPDTFRGLVRVPPRLRPRVVALVHPSLHASDAGKLGITRLDHAICLATALADAARTAMDHRKVSFAPWGPDLHSPAYATPGEGGHLVTCGKTGRDYDTLFRAIDGLGVELRAPAAVAGRGPAGLTGYTPENDHSSLVGSHLADALGICIPLEPTDMVTAGLTELNDALALGKPVVMTESSLRRDIDIEAIGCGRWVKPGDVSGWRAAITELAADPAGARERGRAGRRFAETSWNYELFGRHLVEVVAGLE